MWVYLWGRVGLLKKFFLSKLVMEDCSNLEFSAIQVNLRKAFLANTLLNEQLGQSDVIAFLTEPYVAYDKLVAMPKGYLKVPSYAIDEGPRAALVIPLILKPIALDHLGNRDCAVALLQLNGSRFLIASAYMDINLPMIPDWLENLVRFSDENNYPLLLCLDSNAHSELYGVDSNNRGEIFEEFILLHGFVVENVGNVPTFQTMRAQSHIDVTLSRGVSVSNWRVSEAYNASDHNSIYFSVHADSEHPRLVRPWHSANWDLFYKSLDLKYNLPGRINRKKLDRLVDYMYRCVENALDRACPVTTSQTKIRSNIWFTDSLFKAQLKVRSQYKRAMQSNSAIEKDVYKSMHKKFRKDCRKARSKSWRKFVSETKSEHEMALLSRLAQHNDRRTLNLLLKPDGSTTLPGTETLEALVSAHFPTATRIEDVVENDSDDPLFSCKEIKAKYDEYVTPDLVKCSLLEFKPLKAPGPDGLKPIVFRHLPDSFIELLCFIYKACLHLRYTPAKWVETRVIWLPKPDKDSYMKPKSFRPISLSNFFLKGLERLLTWRMDKHLEYYPINPKQHGFTKGRSTEGALSNTVDYIESFIFRNQHCLGLFLDIKSAYDSMDVEQIRSALYLHGGDDDLVEWYYAYLNSRILRLNLHDQEIALRATTGFPQGGVASAKFWLIAFNPAIDIINSEFVEGNGYADDCSVVYGGPDIDRLVTRMQRVLDRLVRWGRSCNLSFNHEKSVAMFFTRTQKVCLTSLTIEGHELEYVDEVRYLGIFLDPKLHWSAHVNNRVGRCKKYMAKMAAIAKATFGPKPHLMRWMFTCIVRPMILYGCVVWAHEANNLGVPDRLRKLNRLAMATYTSFIRSTPTRALEIMTDTFPLNLYAWKEGLCAYIRLFTQLTLDWRGYNCNIRFSKSHRKFWMDLITELDIEGYDDVDSCDVMRPFTEYVVRIDSFCDDFVTEEAVWEVFTDGSKSDDKVGAAMLINRNGLTLVRESLRLSPRTSVFQAEITAIGMAARWLSLNRNTYDESVAFYVDSQAALLALRADFIKSKLVLDCVEILSGITGSVNLFWVRGHAGNAFNEEVDALAKAVADADTEAVEIPLSRTEVRNDVLTKLREVWDADWDEYTEARMSKMYFPGQDKLRGKEICNLSRYQLGRLIRVTTGHNQLRYFQHVITPNINPLCRYCDLEPETFYHWASNCPAFDCARQVSFRGVVPSGSDWLLSQMMDFASDPRIVRALTVRDAPIVVEPPLSQQETISDSEVMDDPDEGEVAPEDLSSDSDFSMNSFPDLE